jgi:predicted dehydrogenase
MRNVSLALVGCGWISEAHVRGYRALWEAGCRDFQVTACVDLKEATARERARQIAEFQGSEPAVFTDIKALIAAKVAEAAEVCLPHCFHHSTAIPLLEAGLHVQVEKPLGITARASRAIIAAAKRAQRVLATAENTRRHIGARAAVWAVNQAKLIGEPIHGQASVAMDNVFDLADPKWAWRHVRAINGGGMLIDSGAHFADMAMRLFGEVDEVACETRTLRPAAEAMVPVLGKVRTDVEDWWHAVIRFASGMRVMWTFGSALPGANPSSAVYHGRDGALVERGGWPMHPFEGGGEVRLRGGKVIGKEDLEREYLATLSTAERDRLFPYGIRDSFGIETWDFVDAVATGRKPEMDGEDGLRSKALCLACYESATQGGRAVKYADVLAGKVDAYQRPIDERWGLLAAAAAR